MGEDGAASPSASDIMVMWWYCIIRIRRSWFLSSCFKHHVRDALLLTSLDQHRRLQKDTSWLTKILFLSFVQTFMSGKFKDMYPLFMALYMQSLHDVIMRGSVPEWLTGQT